MPQEDVVAQIRSFNRFYTNILGLLDQQILESGYSLTQARVLFEIGKAQRCCANNLSGLLNIDRSYLSRILKGFERAGLITRAASEEDNRVNDILLTEKGVQVVSTLNQRSDQQIRALISPLTDADLPEVQNAMAFIKSAFSRAVNPIPIRDFIPDDIAYVIARHQELYAQEYRLSCVFAEYVDKAVRRFAEHYNAEKECMLIPEFEGRPVGSIAIAQADEQTAQLRYFLLEPEMRGRGLGCRLMDMALDFCRQKGYRHVFLETFSALKAARHIYQSRGFAITHTHENPEWGEGVLEERWDMDL